MVCSIKGMKNVSVPTAVSKCMNNSIDEPPFYKETSTGSISLIVNNNNIINVTTDTPNTKNYYPTTEYNIFNNNNNNNNSLILNDYTSATTINTSATNTPYTNGITPTHKQSETISAYPQLNINKQKSVKSTRRVLFSEHIRKEEKEKNNNNISDNFDGMYSNKTSINFPSTTRKTES
eukprot:482403_1